MLQLDLTWVAAASLLWVRLGVLLSLSPLAQALRAPGPFWVLLTLVLAGLLSATLGLRAPVPTSLGHYLFALLSEAALGALMGFSLHAAFAALSMAGRLLDLQMGFGFGAVLDPVTRANAPMMGVTLSLLGMAVFFAIDGHHALLRGLVHALRAVPPGAAWSLPNASLLLNPVAAMFTAAIVVVAPALFMLLLVELVLGMASRVLPQMNVLFVGMPVKILVGLSVLAVAAPGMLPALRRAYSAAFEFWVGVFA